MDKDKLEYFKQKLQAEYARLEHELRDLGVEDEETGEWDTAAGDIDETATEPDELADRVEDFEERDGERKAFEVQLQNVERALAHFEEGTYGICEIGGEEIEEDRLEVNPSARTCKEHIDKESELPE
ncbi:MAG: hypothetical protein QG621_350 [Patescibacteria group bacterium]|jgi:RNA polymerase-binding transcription factor DksA|nr:hypothetical protein [Patescibacteria group bacterium]